MKNRIVGNGDVSGHSHLQKVKLALTKTTFTTIDCNPSVRWAKWFCLLTFVFLFVACSGPSETAPETSETGITAERVDEATDTPEAITEPEAEPETEALTDTRIIIDATGKEVEVPVQPQRVVALSERDMDAALALGANVVGVVNGRGSASPPVYLQPLIGEEVAVVGPFFAPNAEAILELEPDLILIGGLFPDLEALVPSFAEIAPVVITFNSGDDWRTSFLGVADALNQMSEAEAWLTAFDEHAKAVAAEIPEGNEVSIVRFNPDGPVIMSPMSFASLIAKEAGMSRPEAHMEIEGPGHSNTISEEVLQTIDADYMFVGALNPDGLEVLETALDKPIYSALNVVKNEAYAVVDGAVWTSLGGPLAAQTVLADIEAAYGLKVAETTTAADEAPTDTAVTIEHKFGSSTIPATPERIVTIGYSEQDVVLALGVAPIAIRDWFGDQPYGVWPWSQAALGEATPELMQMPYGELNFEFIAALNPDLLIATHSGITEEEYKLLSHIAPVLAQPADYPDFGVPWQVQTQLIGQALGRSAEAGALIGAVEGGLAAANQMNGGFGGATVAWANPTGDGQFWVVGQNTPPMRFLARLGLVNDPTLQEIIGDLDSAQISEEQFNLLDVDLLILQTATAEARAELEANPLLSQLDVFKEGRVIFFETNDPIYGALSFSTIASLPYLLDEFVPMIVDRLGSSEIVVNDSEVSDTPATASAITSGPITPLPRTVVDYEGNEVVIEDDSVVIAIDGPLTEIVFALGMGDKVVATDVSSTYPPEATALPQVGYVRSLSAEPVLAMAPTLILTTDSAGPPTAVEQLQESGVAIVQFTAPSTVAESLQLVRDVAAALGVESRGEALVAKMEADLAEAANLLAQVETTPRVMFIYARGVDTVSAAGSGTSIDVIFELAGVENAVTEWEGYQPLTAEGAVTIAPDALLLFETGLESVGGAEGLLGIPGLAETPAGQDEQVHSMDGLLLTGLGPRVGEAVIELIKMLHPELS